MPRLHASTSFHLIPQASARTFRVTLRHSHPLQSHRQEASPCEYPLPASYGIPRSPSASDTAPLDRHATVPHRVLPKPPRTTCSFLPPATSALIPSCPISRIPDGNVPAHAVRSSAPNPAACETHSRHPSYPYAVSRPSHTLSGTSQVRHNQCPSHIPLSPNPASILRTHGPLRHLCENSLSPLRHKGKPRMIL